MTHPRKKKPSQQETVLARISTTGKTNKIEIKASRELGRNENKTRATDEYRSPCVNKKKMGGQDGGNSRIEVPQRVLQGRGTTWNVGDELGYFHRGLVRF